MEERIMKIKRIKKTAISLLLLMVFMFSSTTYALTPDPKVAASEQEVYFLDMGHGEFKVNANITTEQKLNSGSKKIKAKNIDTDVYEILDVDALAENKEYNKLIKVNEDTLLRVKELKINLLDSKQMEKYIEEYEINPEMAKDIRERAALAQEKESKVDDELTIYTPNFAKEAKNTLTISTGIELASASSNLGVSIASLAPQSSYYYVGYNNENYKDEIWYGNNSPTYYTIRQGYTTKDYFDDVLNNFVDYTIGTTFDTLSGGAYSIAMIFANSPILTYPANSGDVWQAALNETKWRKYTSIEMWDDVTYQYQYYTRAVSDSSYTYFSHYLYRAYSRTKEYKNDYAMSTVNPNYHSLDRMAYLYMYDLPYTEYIQEYSVNNYTNFASQ